MLRAFQWDLARQVERLDHLLDLLPRYADWGYERLYLHLEDAVDYPSLPRVARADAYAWRDLEKLVSAASARGIRVVPIGNLLGHTQYLIKTDAWRDLNELRDPATGAALPVGQICPLHPRMPELAEKLIGDLAPLCTAGEIHVGLDESFHLGKHPLSRDEIAEAGLAGHFARHVARLHGIASARGLRMGLWADMLALLPEAIPLIAPLSNKLPAPRSSLPALSAYDWYYHPFAQRPRMELYNFSEYDLAPALRAAGVAYWACPMNGAFRHEVAPVWGERLQNLAAWWRRARAVRADGYLVTSWEPYRLALGTTTLMDAAAAALWLEPQRGDDPATLLASGLRRRAAGLGATSARTLARGLLATDALAFAGNSRWEINTRWDSVGPRRESPRPHAAAARRLARLARNSALSTPPLACLAATLRFQSHLAARDAFVRQAASHATRLRRLASRVATPVPGVPEKPKHGRDGRGRTDFAKALAAAQEAAAAFALRLRTARKDAREMWTWSRPAESFATSQNAGVLVGDALRLRAWQAWLRAVSRRPAHARRAAPVLGRWTLRFTVHHFAPAWQKVVVEQQQPDGSWRELHGRVTIEFRARAARPRPTQLRLEFACPVDDPDAPLRIATRCVGQVAISHIDLTDGVVTREHRPLRTRHILGEPAPKSGWPKVDWARNTGELSLHWSR